MKSGVKVSDVPKLIVKPSKACGTPWGTRPQQGTFFQALIQIAAANFKRFLGNEQAATNLARGGLTSTIEAKYP